MYIQIILSQTLDIEPRFVLQFVVYFILFIVSIQLFGLTVIITTIVSVQIHI